MQSSIKTCSRSTWSRKALAGAFTLALVGAATAGAGVAAADEQVGPPAGIDLTLEVVDQGALTMTVDTTEAVELVEQDAVDENRVFTGTLPTVTVQDTRSDIPEGLGWSVVAIAEDFAHEDDDAVLIDRVNMGWTPRLVDEPADPDDQVVAGSETEPAVEGGIGMTEGLEIMMFADRSGAAQDASQSWQATADLRLVAPAAELETGNYTSTLTLSLFEQDFGF